MAGANSKVIIFGGYQLAGVKPPEQLDDVPRDFRGYCARTGACPART
jgi:hypothetical protein